MLETGTKDLKDSLFPWRKYSLSTHGTRTIEYPYAKLNLNPPCTIYKTCGVNHRPTC